MVRVLKTFEKCSGLQASAKRTAIYFGNVANAVKLDILRAFGFVEGDTPFRYLGIPLNVRCLSNKDYDCLVDKMLTKITCWSSRNLSYAARCLLVNTVLLSLHTYWSQCVLLPAGVVKRITQICRAFLWNGSSQVMEMSVHQEVLNMGPVLTEDQGRQICRPFSLEDVKQALWGIEENKAPGLDGYSSKFFKASWHIVGQDLSLTILDFFQNGKLLSQVNTTVLTMVPKVDNASKVSQYRPIACCNVLYKVIARMICSRLKEASAEKTAIYFGNVANAVKLDILRASGFVEGDTPFRCPGEGSPRRPAGAGRVLKPLYWHSGDAQQMPGRGLSLKTRGHG
uniref:Uncharacterized protein n=1 Tax=Chenopodium quinoa TaxID=63459 RepID=A0A803N4Z2_CHEQI